MAVPGEKELRLLEDRVTQVLKRYRSERTRATGLQSELKDLQERLDRQQKDTDLRLTEQKRDMEKRFEEEKKVLQKQVEQQKAEIERLGKKAAVAEGDLDDLYLRSRDRLRSRVSSLLSRLDTL